LEQLLNGQAAKRDVIPSKRFCLVLGVMADLQPCHFEPERVPNAEDNESENEEVNDFAIDLFCLLILFPQCRSCDDTKESIFFESWIFSCSHAVFLMNTTKVQTS